MSPLKEYDFSDVNNLFNYTVQLPLKIQDSLIKGAREVLDDEETCRTLGINYNEREGTDWMRAVAYVTLLKIESGEIPEGRIPENLRKAFE